MAESSNLFRHLQQAYEFESPSGFVQTLTPRVKIFWSTANNEKAPPLPGLSIAIMLSGRKSGRFHDTLINYEHDNYLVTSTPVPFECESSATEHQPLLGVIVDIDLATLNRFTNIPGVAPIQPSIEPTFLPLGLQPEPVDKELSDASRRLVRTLCSPSDTMALGSSIADEIMYRALRGKHGPALLALSNPSSHYARVSRAISKIHEDPAGELSVDMLAAVAGMSIRSFHRAFKIATRQTPLQYLKIVRLNMAMNLLRSGRRDVGAVAREAGYESNSQFSREFKRHFLLAPAEIKFRRHS